ncbi:MAG: erythromycin biosynthesis sensory transduction protein eryC1, partial [Burkholderiales bacterium]|nr:erythromycin biosynthesis sensory transduction protein eryC1 [Burkholderiales bacterium]
ERVRTRLRHAGIETAIHYPTPIHLMPAYAFLGYCEGSLPGTEYLASRVLSLPLYPALAETDVDRIC